MINLVVPGRAATRAAALLLLLLAAVGCASQPSAPARAGSGRKALAADYLAIARPANHRLDVEVNSYDRHEHDNLALAETALRAEAATERTFDRLLLKIAFSPRIAATARALVRVNQRRITLTGRQARSASIAGLVSLDARHKAADAAVEAQVRLIRAELGLPPPGNS